MAVLVESRAPGVRLQVVANPPAPVLETGVPVFVGLRRIASPAALLDLAGALGFGDGFGSNSRPFALNGSSWAALDGAFGSAWVEGLLGFSVRGFFDNGGQRCYVLLHAAGGLTAALAQLDALDDFDVVCAPDSAGNDIDHVALLDLCSRRPGCFALLDGPGKRLPDPNANANALSDCVKRIQANRSSDVCVNGAFYGPWIKVRNACPTCSGQGCPTCNGTGLGFIPPSGHVAGVLSRLDRQVGVHRAPANEPIEGAYDVQIAFTDSAVSDLNLAGVVPIRAIPGRGIRPWGARTLAPNDPDFAHVNVRRTYLTIDRWLNLRAADMAFEPNDFRLWLRVQREVTAFLVGLYQRGALLGATAADAFYVKCDDETNPPALRDSGTMVAEIGVAIARPNEFIVLRLMTGAGNASVSGS